MDEDDGRWVGREDGGEEREEEEWAKQVRRVECTKFQL